MTDVKLPELPDGTKYTMKFTDKAQIGTEITMPLHYSVEQMDAHGMACYEAGVRAGMERAAQICEELQRKTFDEAPRPFGKDWELDATGNDCAAAIRSESAGNGGERE